MSFDPKNYFTLNAILEARELIKRNDGNEIVMIGTFGSDGLVSELRCVAMGNSYSVPAVIQAAEQGEVLIHNHPSGDVRPSSADLDVAARAAERRIASFILDNSVTSLFPVVERFSHENDEIVPLDEEEVASVLGKDGAIAQGSSEFEFRAPQVEMALHTAEAINNSQILVAEAGTGIGKSFAYLVPILLYVSKNKGKKAVVSTSTIALEEQLSEKDIPFLLKKLGIDDIDTAVLKGRGNYLCKRRYTNFRMSSAQAEITDDRSKQRIEIINEIDTWMGQVNDGTRTTMNSAVAGDIWSEICSDELSCEKSRCRFFNTCYFFKARRKANFASLILVNHHLLMADVAVREENDEMEGECVGILPNFDILVIDEAHNIFKSAISFLGESVSTVSFTRQLNRLHNKNSGGLLPKILNNLAKRGQAEAVEKAIVLMSGLSQKFANSIVPELYAILGNDDEGMYELDDPEIRSRMLEKLNIIIAAVGEAVALLKPVITALRDEDEAIEHRTPQDDINRSLLIEASGALARIESYAGFYSEFCLKSDVSESVFWGEREQKTALALTVTPLNVQRLIAKYLYEKIPAIVMTSATLTTSRDENGYDFFFRESGLSEVKKREIVPIILDSCFDFSTQVQAYVCSDLPSPAENKVLFDDLSIDAVDSIINASHGGALVLFTSIKHREEAARRVFGLGFDVLCQGSTGNSSIMRKFRDNVNSSLLATDTFWEGIDMKGATLRNLVIVKLPFRFPTHPFVKRYIRKLENELGQRGFVIYTLPNAVIKFKQGFGRLIRTKNDIGTITVLDNRLVDKYYGRDFLKAAPSGVKFKYLRTGEVAESIRKFFSD
ncbi:DEAD/DEAH box helicase family protein [bacterium]|nr:DEAD/DEAH box helicase family protein [bacterium]